MGAGCPRGDMTPLNPPFGDFRDASHCELCPPCFCHSLVRLCSGWEHRSPKIMEGQQAFCTKTNARAQKVSGDMIKPLCHSHISGMPLKVIPSPTLKALQGRNASVTSVFAQYVTDFILFSRLQDLTSQSSHLNAHIQRGSELSQGAILHLTTSLALMWECRPATLER